MKRKSFFAGAMLAAGLAMLTVGAAADAAIVLHTGANDPTTEGWTLDAFDAANVPMAPIINDAGTGYDAWAINDNSGTGYGWFHDSLTSSEQASLLGNDWVGTVRLRLPNANTAESGAITLDFNLGTGNKRFLIYLGTNASGDTKYQIYRTSNDGGNLLTANEGLNGTNYQLYEFKYDHVSTTVDIYINGNLFYADWAGIAGNTAAGANGGVSFGSSNGVAVGHGNYNLVDVSLAPVPEPSALSLLGLGALAGLRRRRH